MVLRLDLKNESRNGAIAQLPAEDRLEIVETISRMMRDQLAAKAKLKAERQERLKIEAEAARPLYEPGGPLHDLWFPDSEPYFESEEEYLECIGDGVEANAPK
ncbi:MAG: hypothetical protein SVX43_07895 [Cyanobacteriota bacterium]|nr:hypothetical protein [Cyanobacteriota bacterium]